MICDRRKCRKEAVAGMLHCSERCYELDNDPVPVTPVSPNKTGGFGRDLHWSVPQHPQAERRPRECPWCAGSESDEWSDEFCIWHEAEYEGLSVDQLERRDREQYAEEADAKGWR